MREVAFAVPAEAAFDFLVDPRNRPLWQSSLRRVDAVSSSEPAVGQSWTDVTAVGARPAMQTTVLDRPRTWTERGRWRSLEAELTVAFAERPDGCAVRPSFVLRGRGPTALVARALSLAAPFAVRADLRRAARILSERSAGH